MKKLLLSLLFIIFTFAHLQASEEVNGYKYQIAAVLLFQNEADFLEEWLKYHKLVGVEHFYLFDNASTDHFMDVIQPYIDSGEVELFHNPKITFSQREYLKVQCGSYNQALELARGKVKWLAIIDADELIVPLKSDHLLPVLDKYSKYGGVYVNWLMFGTSHVEKIPSDRLMIEMLNHSAKKPTSLGKSIVRPERVSKCTDPHRMWYYRPYVHVNTDYKKFNWHAPIADDQLLIHHYATRDIDFLRKIKIPRLKKWRTIKEDAYLKSVESSNARQNDTMQRFIPRLREHMNLPAE